MAGILPPELILEILSWLPVTSLMRFRCVSKTWKFFISNPYLVKLHFEKSSRNPQILLMATQRYNPCFLARLCSLPCLIQNPAPSSCGRTFRCPKPYEYLFGSCNGLLSLHNSLSTKKYEEHWVRFWNPATNIWSRPSPRLRLNLRIYDPDEIDFGFAYDDRRDNYMVVAIVLDRSIGKRSVWVYCMGDVRWRRSVTSPIFFLTRDEIESTIIALFALKDVRDERSWSWLLNVSYETLNISPYLHQLQILGMLGDLLLLSYTYLDASNIIITFNFKENKVEHTQTYYRKFIFSCNYVPSLILSV
ncbi:F-box/kelch-repeat protein At3g23880-like isoform X1 [Vigna radiata var. radiata]|uniref:F-box/kelch-repeat protein At3g23880-like isoform X1 n=1 Tax=Vigna radiata var. radiata TaxID=3916 RepID=A0A3Q0EUN4_VIGRR|nr:F-box/kelch-repeat protein At3g23880-like isoform X1 [Vigna radiata var. radiata]